MSLELLSVRSSVSKGKVTLEGGREICRPKSGDPFPKHRICPEASFHVTGTISKFSKHLLADGITQNTSGKAKPTLRELPF